MKLVSNTGFLASSIRTIGDFELFSPVTSEAATAMCAGAHRPVAFVSGGTDICAQFNEGLQLYSLVDIGRIESLKQVVVNDGMLRIGSGVSLFDVSSNPLTRRVLPGFAGAMDSIANVRVRFRATIGGNIMARRKRYEATLLALAARAGLGFLDKGRVMEMSVEEFLRGGKPDDALLTQIQIPADGWLDFQYERALRPFMTLAFSAWRTAAGVSAHAVIATEFLDPVVLPLELTLGRLSPADSEKVARRAFMSLPEDFADVVSSNWYLRTAGQALLARQLRSMDRG